MRCTHGRASPPPPMQQKWERGWSTATSHSAPIQSTSPATHHQHCHARPAAPAWEAGRAVCTSRQAEEQAAPPRRHPATQLHPTANLRPLQLSSSTFHCCQLARPTPQAQQCQVCWKSSAQERVWVEEVGAHFPTPEMSGPPARPPTCHPAPPRRPTLQCKIKGALHQGRLKEYP